MSERIRNSKASGGCSRSKPRTARLRRSLAIARSVTTAKRPVSTTSTSVCSASAAAKASKPGPRVAEEAGRRTRRRRSIRGGTLSGPGARARASVVVVQELTWRQAGELASLTREVGLVGVAGRRRGAGQLDLRQLHLVHEALEAQDAVQGLGREADVADEAAQQLALAEVRPRGRGGDRAVRVVEREDRGAD